MLKDKFRIIYFIILFVFSCSENSTDQGDYLFEKGKFKQAIQSYTSYLNTYPNHIHSLYNRARSYEEIKDYENAFHDFDKVLNLDPKHFQTYLSLSKMYYNEQNYSKGLIYAEDALKLNNNSSKAHYFMARAEHQQGFFSQALESYNNVLRIDKDYGDAYLYRGALRVTQKQMRLACEDFIKADLLEVKDAKKALLKYCRQ